MTTRFEDDMDLFGLEVASKLKPSSNLCAPRDPKKALADMQARLAQIRYERERRQG